MSFIVYSDPLYYILISVSRVYNGGGRLLGASLRLGSSLLRRETIVLIS